MAIGVDVFSGNGQIDWKSAKANGNVSFALVRATESTVLDEQYPNYITQCAAQGIRTGAWMFFHWTGASPETQATMLINAIGKPDKRGFPPAIDVEFPHGRSFLGITPSQCRDVLERCVRVVRDAIGVWPMIYTSLVVCEDPDGLDNVIADSDLGNCPLWIKYWPFPEGSQAVYSPSQVNALSPPHVPLPWGNQIDHARDAAWVIQQTQGDATNLPGFKTKVDMNRVHVVQKGDTGDTVKLVQRLAGGLTVDGSFGPKTADRVRELQLAAGYAGDGIVGLETWPILLWRNT